MNQQTTAAGGREKTKRKWKEKFMVDATPDGNYALRILQAYRRDCDSRWSDNTAGIESNNPLIVEMNRLQEERAKELDIAIEKLTK